MHKSNFKAEPRWIKQSTDVLSVEKSIVKLECDAESYPPSTINWYKIDVKGQKMFLEI